MRIDFLGLHAFVAIAERGSFQNAAAHLNLSQTALSHRIRKLEEDLGVKLLSRTTREVSLTQAGLNLLPKVKDTIEMLIKDPFTLVCPEEHPLASQPSVSWSDLSGEPLIRVSQQTGNRMIIDDALGSRREGLNWRFEVQHLQTAIALAAAGVALTVVPRMALDAVHERGLKLVPLRNPSITRQIGIVSRRGSPLSPMADELRRIILKAFA